MIRYLLQVRLVKLPDPDTPPDRWSSAESTMTECEVSVPFDSDYDPPTLITSDTYLDAVTKAIGRLSMLGEKQPQSEATDGNDHLQPDA